MEKGLIRGSQSTQALFGRLAITEDEPGIGQVLTYQVEFFSRKPVRSRRFRTQVKDPAEFDCRQTPDRKCHSRLECFYTFYAREQDCAGIQDARQTGQPALVIVLGAVVAQHRI